MPASHALPPCRDVRRRALALWGALLWVLGFELGPDLHLGLHGVLAPHSHVAAPSRGDDHAHADAHAHAHDDAHDDAHDHAHDHDHDHDYDVGLDVGLGDAGQDGRDSSVGVLEVGHGRHDAAHRGIAVVAPSSVMPEIVAAPVHELVLVQVHAAFVLDGRPMHVRARGPPWGDAAQRREPLRTHAV